MKNPVTDRKYTAAQIAAELAATALGAAYFGNALYVSLDIPCITENERLVLQRWLNGTNTASDGLSLQEIANKIATSEDIYARRDAAYETTKRVVSGSLI